MNRTIKFRAWNLHTKKMLLPSDVSTMPMVPEVRHADGNTGTIYLQWTGLTDKNGVEIYEGDVVGYSFLHGIHYDEDGNAVEEDWDGGKILVSWDAENARFHTPMSDTENIPVQLAKESIEVIGNIYENPELLSV